MQDGQTIHRSVLKRFLHYRSTTGPSETTSNKAGSPDAQQAPSFSAVPALGMSSQKVGLREPKEYPDPRGRLPAEWGISWDEIRQGEGGSKQIWEF